MEHANCNVSVETKPSAPGVKGSKESLFSISGMGCQNCANRVHNSLLRQQGVLDVIVDLEMHSAQVNYDPGVMTIENLIAAVSAAGNDGHHSYSASLIA